MEDKDGKNPTKSWVKGKDYAASGSQSKNYRIKEGGGKRERTDG